MVEGKVFIVDMRKVHLKESRADRENTTLNMAIRLNWTTRRETGRMREKDQDKKKVPRKLVAEMAGLYRNEKLGEGKRMCWRNLGWR